MKHEMPNPGRRPPHNRARRASFDDAQPLAETVVGAVPVILDNGEMQKALDAGLAVPLSPVIGDYVHHENHWWIADADRWLRIDDPQLHNLLSAYRRRLVGGLYESE